MKIVKKVLLMALSFVLVAAISVGATLAFLADTDSDVNVMTVGNVKIDQVEYERSDVEATVDAAIREFTQAKPLDPAVYAYGYDFTDTVAVKLPALGVTVNLWDDISNEQDKFVFVKNIGMNKAYLRTWFAFELGDLSLDDWSKMFHINKNTTDWDWTTVGTAEIDNVQHAVVYATYKTALAPGALAAPSLLQYAMDEDATNETVASFKGSYDILVFSQAVQTTGFDNADQALLKAFTLKTPWGDTVINSKPATGSLESAIAGLPNKPTVQLNLSGNISWTTGAGIGSTPVLDETSTIESLYLMGTSPADTKLTVGGSGVGALRAANGGKLVFSNMTIVDESVSYAENSWEYGYLEFGGNLVFVNCVFEGAIMVEGDNTNATFLNCTFKSLKDSEYAVWVADGTVTFDNCTFAPYRGLKIHEAYGSEVSKVVVENCTFGPLTKKPGIAIGDLNANTSVTVVNNIFNGCQAGDQGLYIYETDTDVSTFSFVCSDNIVGTSTVADLKAALAAGGNVALTDDVDAGGQVHVSNGSVLDGNGKTITVNSGAAAYESGLTVTEGTAKNIIVTGAYRALGVGGSGASAMTGDVTYENVTVKGATYGVNIGVGNGHKLTMINCTFGDWNSYAGLGSAEFVGCTFTAEGRFKACQRISANATFTYTDCEFAVDTYDATGYYLDSYGNGTIILENCTVGGVKVTAENVDDFFNISSKVTVIVN